LTAARFPEPESLGEREWGLETQLGLASGKYVMKYIFMKEGSEGGLQYHRLKDEMGFMLHGQMGVLYDDGDGNLVPRTVGPGDVFHFPTGCRHKAVAITDCAYVECSTPHFNDRVHVEADYGIDTEAGGLPSTELEEIEVR
jgi:quercetin dioxygenase-like cupin family protein